MADAAPSTLPGIKGMLALPAIAIFGGSFALLTFKFEPGVLSKIHQVLGQDLRAGPQNTALDLTDKVKVLVDSDELQISGELIKEVGTHAMTAGDLSEPGLVLAITLTPSPH